MSLYDKHKEAIDRAIQALHDRSFYAMYPEHPSPKVYGEDADKTGQEKFQAMGDNKFDELLQAEPGKWAGEEESPYLDEPLNIQYPIYSSEELVSRAKEAGKDWRKISVKQRAGILVESLERMKDRFFQIAYATMHTTGQGYMMAFQASGPHAADRAMEAIAAGFEEMSRYPENVFWDKPAGKYNQQLNKQFTAVPKGVSVVIGCSTFPIWNSVPGIYASLVTGNPVIVKPHPKSVLPIAIVVAEIQKVLQQEGFDPQIVQLGTDTSDHLIAKEIAEHKDVKLIDFTGGSSFGSYLEDIKGKTVFTEKTGVNSVILDSTDNLDKALGNLAFSVCLYSGQMCTAPQNFYIPEDGVNTPDGLVSFDEVASRFVDAIQMLTNNPKAGPYVLGAIQNSDTLRRLDKVDEINGKVILTSVKVNNPLFPNAITASPVVLTVDAKNKEEYGRELFGPIVILVKTKSTDHSIELAAEMATNHGAISCAAYSIDDNVKQKIREEMAMAYTPVSFNLLGSVYVNQNAGFSDFHVSGGNPSGNASFTNPEYIVKRFTWVGFREPAPAEAEV